MIGVVDPLEPIALGWAIVVSVALVLHVRKRHRDLRRRPRLGRSPDTAHPFYSTSDDPHRCGTCGRDASHDIHHRVGGIG